MREDIKETRFDNGLVVLTDRMTEVRSATLGFFVRKGARHETRELHGMSHFIEHAVFKGTGKRSALDIAIEQDRLGGDLDAYTTHEETGFAIKVIDDELPAAFDLISDMLLEPKFDQTDLDAEAKVIIEEMKMIEDDPEDLLGDIFSEAFFPGHALGMSITGTPQTVRSFDREKTRAYHERVFNGSNLVIAAAGNVEHERLLELVRNTDLSRPASAESLLKQGLQAPEIAAPIVVRQKDDLEQAHLVIATQFVTSTDERRYAADLLTNILGGGMSSRLWQKIREERGLAYSVGTSDAMYDDCGVFSVFAGTSPEQVREVVEISIEELRKVVDDGVTEAELTLAKQTSRASILLSLEDSASRAAALAESEMVHGRQIPVEETLAKIDGVTADDCQAIAREFFKTEDVAFAALGNLGEIVITRDDLRIN
jgi:predicted Zn-dependent peptidase